MLKMDDFKKLTKSQVLNARYIRGGENNQQTTYTAGDDYAHTSLGPNGDSVVFSGHVPRGGTAEADPLT
jgi:hypothetical protein